MSAPHSAVCQARYMGIAAAFFVCLNYIAQDFQWARTELYATTNVCLKHVVAAGKWPYTQMEPSLDADYRIRRKKSRCPGEKPACSCCVRLRQICIYPGNPNDQQTAGHGSNNQLVDRRVQLEERSDLVPKQPAVLDHQLENPGNGSSNNSSPHVQTRLSASGLLPSDLMIGLAIEVYYEYAHRQPLWLFERDNGPDTSSSEELILAILSVAAQHPSEISSYSPLLAPESYSKAARSLIMTKIATASVDLSVLQALCLLAYSNHLSNDVNLASFHTMLARTLLQSSGLETQSLQGRSFAAEDKRRLIWSVFLLFYVYGQQQQSPSLLEDIHVPRFFKLEVHLQHTSDLCPSLPLESIGDTEQNSVGIWAYMVSILSLWTELRNYISKCAGSQISAPWKPDSTYTLINSHILELERKFPAFCRFDSANFAQQSEEAVNSKRDFWLPWLRIQIHYHTVHCVINHPFLFSAAKPRTVTGSNAFWKSASQLALSHSNWISGLLQMAKEKGLHLSDPGFTYSAVVAATLHSYWSRASSPTIKALAEKNLHLCLEFVDNQGPKWPICQHFGSLLHKFLDLMVEAPTEPLRLQSNKAKVSVMWDIFGYAASRPDHQGKGLVQPFFYNDQELRQPQGDFSVDDRDIESLSEHDHFTNEQTAVPAHRLFSPRHTPLEAVGILPNDQIVQQQVGFFDAEVKNSWLGWTNAHDQSTIDPSMVMHVHTTSHSDWWTNGIL